MSTITASGVRQSEYFPGGAGTLPPDAPCYVTRQADADLLAGLRHHHFCYVLTSRQMGKSSLMLRTAESLKREAVQVAVIDLTAIGRNVTIEQWYDGIVAQIGKHLKLEDELDDFWLANERMAPLQRFLAALREVALVRIAGDVVLMIDEVDVVRSLDFSADEFFAGIRQCHNLRASEIAMRRLTFALFGVAAPSDLIHDTRITPFNIGQRIELRDFSATEASLLAAGLGSGGRQVLERVLYWTGGHPYLTLRLCRAVVEGAGQNANDVDTAAHGLFFASSVRMTDDNLVFVRERLLRSEVNKSDLLSLYGRVHRGENVADAENDPLVSALRLSGIVGVSGGRLRVRNRIYGKVFNRQWAEEQLEEGEAKRIRKAFQSGKKRALRWIAGTTLVTIYLITGRPAQLRVASPYYLAEDGAYWISKSADGERAGSTKKIDVEWDAPRLTLLKLSGSSNNHSLFGRLTMWGRKDSETIVVPSDSRLSVVTYGVHSLFGNGSNMTLNCLYTRPDAPLGILDNGNLSERPHVTAKGLEMTLDVPKGGKATLTLINKTSVPVRLNYWPVRVLPNPNDPNTGDSDFYQDKDILPGVLNPQKPNWSIGKDDPDTWVHADFVFKGKPEGKIGATDYVAFATTDSNRPIVIVRLKLIEGNSQ